MRTREHRSFALVLAGGGARGFAHVGVLRALEQSGWRPAALVGVSMGALVGVTYALRPDWYRALVGLDTSGLPSSKMPLGNHYLTATQKLRRVLDLPRALWSLVRGWGQGEKALELGRALLEELTLGLDLENGRIPLAVGTTDLNSGERVVLTEGPAASAVYASVALAGILPPLRSGDRILADGAYADIAPIDVGRAFGCDAVIAVDPSQAPSSTTIENGLQAMVRAVDICHMRHADLRFAGADFVIRPRFRRAIDTLEFSSKRDSIAAGFHGVRSARRDLAELLST